MNTKGKNILYTYVQPNELISQCVVQLYSLCLSVQLVKKNLEHNKIKLYTTPEVIEFFSGVDYFDELIDITEYNQYIQNQNPGILHKNMLYKIFVPTVQTEPFIHIDIDFLINDPDPIRYGVNQKVFFGFKESVVLPNTEQMVDQYYHYFQNLVQILNRLNQDELKQLGTFNPMNAFNCSIFGCDGFELIKSFTRARDFYVSNYEKLNEMEFNIPSFIEQYLQVSYLLEDVNFLEITTVNNDLYLPQNVEFGEFDLSTYNHLHALYHTSKLVHLSGTIFIPYYQLIISEHLNDLNPDMVTRLVGWFGTPDWFKYQKLLTNH
jgi:hypothetical protein